jgi:pyruvate, water dikinase
VLVDLADADPATSGGKAAVLARLLRAGLPVPPGFVVPTAAYDEAVTGLDLAGAAAAYRLVARTPVPPALVDAISRALGRLAGPSGGAYVAVRSSATGEDTADATAAGQHDTFLGVSGPGRVADAVRGCWASLWSERAVGYRRRHAASGSAGSPTTAVLVQRLVDADVAGVMFTGTDIRLEASWGLGESVVSGLVTPDSWVVSGDDVVHRVLGAKDSRIDRAEVGVVTREVPLADRGRFCLTDDEVGRLARLGRETADLLDGPQDIEWAIADGRIWLLQPRPPPRPRCSPARGTPPPSPARPVAPESPPDRPGWSAAPATSPGYAPATFSSAGPRTRRGRRCSGWSPRWSPRPVACSRMPRSWRANRACPPC